MPNQLQNRFLGVVFPVDEVIVNRQSYAQLRVLDPTEPLLGAPHPRSARPFLSGRRSTGALCAHRDVHKRFWALLCPKSSPKLGFLFFLDESFSARILVRQLPPFIVIPGPIRGYFCVGTLVFSAMIIARCSLYIL